MSIIVALNSVITVLRRTHVLGEESANFAKAIDLLVQCVHALEEDKKKREDQHADHNEQGKNI